MSTEITTAAKENTALATVEAHEEQVLQSDVLIPRVLLMQGLSDFVTERRKSPDGVALQQGDMVRSTNLEILGNPERAMEILPLTTRDTWVEQEKVGKKFEFRTSYPRNAKNETLPWSFYRDAVTGRESETPIPNATEWRRVKCIDLFALIVSDIEAEAAELKRAEETGDMPDFNKTLLPVVITFRSTSYNAGKKVKTHFAKAMSPFMVKSGAKAYAYSLKLTCHQESNELGTYYVYDVENGGKATPSQVEAAKNWHSILATKAVRVDDSVDEEGPGAGSGKTEF